MTKAVHMSSAGVGRRNSWRDESSDVSCMKVSDGADVSFCGRVFHSREAASGKAWSVMVERRVRRMTRDD